MKKKILKINMFNQENSKATWKFLTAILILISLASYFLFSALSNVIIFIQGAASLMSLALWGIGSVSIICLTRAQVEDRSVSSQLKLMCSAQKPNSTPTDTYWRKLFKAQCAHISPHRTAHGGPLSTIGTWPNIPTPNVSYSCLYPCTWSTFITAPTFGYNMHLLKNILNLTFICA